MVSYNLRNRATAALRGQARQRIAIKEQLSPHTSSDRGRPGGGGGGRRSGRGPAPLRPSLESDPEGAVERAHWPQASLIFLTVSMPAGGRASWSQVQRAPSSNEN